MPDKGDYIKKAPVPDFTKEDVMKKFFFVLICLFFTFGRGYSAGLPEELKNKTIGVQLGTTGDIMVSQVSGISVERYNKANDAIQSLLNSKIDAVIIDEQPALQFIQKNPDLKISNQEFAKEEYAIAISKKNKLLKKQINDILAELKADGTIGTIIQNYIGNGVSHKNTSSDPDRNKAVNGTLTVAISATFPPYEYYNNAQITGIDIDLAKIIAQRLNKQLIIEDMEFDAIINAVQSGKADLGIAGMTITPERLRNVDFSIPYAQSKQVVIIRSPDTFQNSSASFTERFHHDFITDARWKYLAVGLGHTLLITFLAVVIGIIAGACIAIIRVSHDKNGSFIFLNFLCRLYLAVIRGTPAMIQLLIMYYVIFSAVNVNKITVAVLAFGLNSAAYVAEIIRSGILSVDNGQNEAARSLGLNFYQTMRFVILPQAFKNTLPALANEFIVLLKETSICGYIGLMDLTRGGDIIRSITYDAFLPLIAVALIYLTLVLILTTGVDKLEKRLKKNER